jgi:O-antigen/teichoic acid export membrane protein
MTEPTRPEGEGAVSGEGVLVSRDVLRGIPWAIASKVVLLAIYSVISWITWNLLGDSEYGVLAKCRTLAECLVVFCGLGLNTSLARFVPEVQVRKDRIGLTWLIRTTCRWEAASLGACGLLLFVARPLVDRYYLVVERDTAPLLWAVFIFVAARSARNYLDNVLTALYRVATTAILSAAQGLLLVGLLIACLSPREWRLATVALSAQSAAMLLAAACATYWLWRYIARLDWKGVSVAPIGSRRLFSLGWASLLNQSGQLIMQRYSEVVFLSGSATAAAVGVYDLGVGQTQMLLTLLPFAVHGLFTSAFSESYTRDPTSLGRLIRTYYKVLIVVLLPMSAFGAFFSLDVFAALFPSHDNRAGAVASWFSVIHVLSFVSVPLSMAIIAKEKVLAMMPLLYLQIAVNLVLDYLLIPKYEIRGATAAVVLTFFSTIPLRLFVARRIIGGLHFPLAFFLRHGAVLYGTAWGLSLLTPFASTCTASWLGRYSGLAAAGLLGVLYLFLYVLAMRYLRLFTRDDAAEFEKMNIRILGRALNFVARH